MQSFVVPGSVVGAAQSPFLQTSPFGHSISPEHVVVQPAAVHTDPGGQLVGGLFAEGRVVSSSATGLIVPVNAVNTKTETPWVLRIVDGKTQKVDIMLGLRDPRTERVEVTSGIGEGDALLRGAAQGIAPGTPIQVGGAE